MDQIYANASVTIIAAADGDTEMGLLGVSKPREPQKRVDIRGVSLLELPIGHEDLTSSKWASRGWTYQEGYLSTRRLIFTKTQILFLCNGMYAAESWQQLLNTTCCSSRTEDFKHLIPKFSVSRREFAVKDLLNQIGEYSKRELTRPGDSLNAFLGVLSYYTKNSAKLTTPVLQLPWGLIATSSPRKGFILHFFWSHRDLATRRRDFPSWSWAGWGGPLAFFGPEIVLHPEHKVEPGPLSYLDWDFSMREEDGRTVKIYDLALKEFEARKLKDRLCQPGPKKLQISCLVIPVSFQDFTMTEHQKRHGTEVMVHDMELVIHVDRNLSDGVYPVLQVWQGVYVGIDQADLRLDQKVEQQDDILGLVLSKRDKYFGWTEYYCLMVRQVDEGLYERVGMLIMSGLDLETYRPKSRGFKYRRKDKMVHLDGTGRVLDKFTISDTQRRFPFNETAEKRTICLV